MGLCVLLITIGLAIQSLFSRAVAHPPLDDPAFYITTARDLAQGRGLVVDAIWSYQIPFSGVTHPSHEHWMPLATGLIAATFAVQKVIGGTFETSLALAQWPGMIMGSLLVPLTYVFGRRHLPGGRANRWTAFGAALLLAVNATLSYQAASADSSAPFAFLAAWALAVSVRPPGEEGGYLGVGLLLGLAYLARADGLLLLVAVPLAWWLLPPMRQSLVGLPDNPAARKAWDLWPRERGSERQWQRALGPKVTNVADLLLAFCLVVGPWLVRNYLAFGTPFPSSVLNQAWLTDYAQTFNYVSHPTWQTLLAEGWPAILAQRGQALLHNGGVFLLSTFAWGLLALPGLWLLRHEWSFWPPIVYAVLLFLVTGLVFPVSTVSGTFYHSIGAIVPFFALAAVHAVQRVIRRVFRNPRLARVTAGAVMAGLLVLAVAQTVTALSSVQARHQAEKAQFEMAADWLEEHAGAQDVIMTNQPYTLHYATGRPCIALPAAESPDAAWKAAQRYRARFLVITQIFGQYPQILHEQQDPRFRLLEADGTTELYEIVRYIP